MKQRMKKNARRRRTLRSWGRLSRRLFLSLILGMSQFLAGVGLVLPQPARAETITYENGASGTRDASGTIYGTASIVLDVDTVFADTAFFVTMPDGQTLEGHCVSFNHWAPADGSYPFSAVPQPNGSYDVLVDASSAPRHPIHDAHPERTFIDPPQNVGRITWTPKVREYPAPVSMRIQKIDAQTRGAQGSAQLAGARFELCYYPGFYNNPGELPQGVERSWTLQAIDDGDGHAVADLANPACLVSGDDYYLDSDGLPTLPAGTFVVREVSAPQGYRPSAGAARMGQVEADGTVNTLGSWPGGDPGVSRLAITDYVERGGIEITKGDADLHAAQPQGGASFEGIVFDVINRNGRAVMVEDEVYEPDEVIGNARLTLDKNGHAQTDDDCLPVGSYDVVETQGNDGYLANEHVWHVEIERDGQMVALSPNSEDPLEDHVARGSVSVTKVDAETKTAHGLGSSTLEGARFEVVNEGPEPVMVNGKICPAKSVCLTLQTNERGMGEAPERTIPVGTYSVRETEPSEGYTKNSSWTQEFSIGFDNQKVELDDERAVPEQVIRGDLRFSKRAASDGRPLAGVAFTVTSLSTGESHVVVTDENGVYDSSSKWTPHTQSTNANDECLNEDETVADDRVRPDVGLWFFGTTTAQNPQGANDELGALPFDTYRISELRGKGNESLGLAEWDVSITEDQQLVDVGSVDDPDLSLRTELSGRAGHHLSEGEMTLTDLVSLVGVTPGQGYTLVGELHRVLDGADLGPLLDSAGKPVQTRQEFIAREPNCEQSVDFDMTDVRAEAGTVVAFETLLQGEVTVAEHADPTNSLQTVSKPTLSTKLACKEELANGKWVRLSDAVSYDGLVPGSTYRIEGSLHDRKTGNEVTDALGEPVRGGRTIVPAASAGTTNIEFVFDGSELTGMDVVAFEQLIYDEQCIVSHEDLDDAAQTVTIPNLDTVPDKPVTPNSTPSTPPAITPVDVPDSPKTAITPTTPSGTSATPSGQTTLTTGGQKATLPKTGTLPFVSGSLLMVSGASTIAWGIRHGNRARATRRDKR